MTGARWLRLLPVLALASQLVFLGAPAGAGAPAGGHGYKSFVSGDESAQTPDPVTGGLLLNGGGDWNYDAFRWFTAHAGHGHIVVLRASGTTESQDEFYNDVKGVLSVRTFVFTDRQAASDPAVLSAVKAADGLFIAGGDQSNYVRMWRGTPLNELIDAHVAAGKPLGGTSAGLAVLGPWLYGSMDEGSITSAEAMADPLGPAVTVEGDFLHNELLAHVFTDSHFDTRARLGRLFAFLAKTHTLDPQRALVGLGVDENSAMTVEADGSARFYAQVPGKHAWLVQPGEFGELAAGTPLNLAKVRVTGIGASSTFNVRTLEVTAPAFVRSYDVVNGVITRQTEESREASGGAAADTVFTHGYIYTVDNVMPTAKALAVRGGQIVYIGDDEGAQSLLGPKTRRIDLAGRMLMPGLVDGHMHPQEAGLQLRDCNLEYQRLTVPQLQSVIQRCIDRASKAGTDDWLVAINWFEQNMLPAGTVLTHAALDGVKTTRPILMRSSYGHSSLVNARALELAQITRNTADPKAGVIVRDGKGEPTGLLEDAAQGLVEKHIPAPTPAENLQATRRALAAMRAQGVTSFLDAATDTDTLTAYARLQAEGELSARAHFAVLIDSVENYDPAAAVAQVLSQRQRYDQGVLTANPTLSVDSAKLFLDGVFSAPSYTGVMLQPYFENTGGADKPDWRPGDNLGPAPYFTQQQLNATLLRLAAAGIDPHMHADGDGAVREALNAIEAMRKAYPYDIVRPAIAHDEIVDPSDYQRYADLNALPVLSFQWEKPNADVNAQSTGYLGPVRAALCEPAGLLKLYGARIVFGSDWPVDPLDEWLAMQVAVTRSAIGEKAVRYPGRLGIDPGLTIAEAVQAMTLNGAYSLREDAVTGSLTTGKFADLIILDRNLMQIAPEKIAKTQVLLTMVGGRVVFQSPVL